MNSFIAWIGGKKLLRKEIVARFPAERPERYIEVFGGAAWVLFYKDSHANIEVYNDLNGELVNLFRCVRNHAEELQRNIWTLNSRELFLDYKSRVESRGLTDIQRAANYFQLIKYSFGSDRDSYSCNKRDITKAVDYLLEVQKRLAPVVIENLDFQHIIKTYDKPGSLFYLDPPYHGTEKYYGTGFTEVDHERLRDALAGIGSRFILSYNDDEYIRALYKDYKIESIERQLNLTCDGRRFGELIIKNY